MGIVLIGSACYIGLLALKQRPRQDLAVTSSFCPAPRRRGCFGDLGGDIA
jgi:hypothetical protein